VTHLPVENVQANTATWTLRRNTLIKPTLC